MVLEMRPGMEIRRLLPIALLKCQKRPCNVSKEIKRDLWMVLEMRSGMEIRRLLPISLSLRNPDIAYRFLYWVSHTCSSFSAPYIYICIFFLQFFLLHSVSHTCSSFSAPYIYICIFSFKI